MKKNTFFRRRAFTLIELMVVISIIGILATMITINLQGAQAKSRDTKRKADLSMIMSAIVMYGADNGGVLPGTDGNIETTNTAAGGNRSLDTTVRADGYIDKMPIDPKCHGVNCSSGISANFTGYSYYRADQTNMGCLACPGIIPSTNTKKGFVYAGLENPTDEDSATMSSLATSLDYCVATTRTYTCNGTGVSPNFKLGN